jgi:hypothetical protein
MFLGIRTATASARTVVVPAAETVRLTTDFLSPRSVTRPRITNGKPSGVGRK